MTDRELMQQALAALSAMLTHMGMDEDEWNRPTFNQCRKAEAALRERLAQPEQEPVAWLVYTLDGKSVCVTDDPTAFSEAHRTLPLYTTPQPRQEQEPFMVIAPECAERGCMGHDDRVDGPGVVLQPRQWQGLTDEEVENFLHALWPPEATPTDYIRALEAHLKKKNT